VAPTADEAVVERVATVVGKEMGDSKVDGEGPEGGAAEEVEVKEAVGVGCNPTSILDRPSPLHQR
jgi:hypothetical protein